jgi:subtilase family serine protease
VEEQTDETSPRYHKWLTKKQFSDRFGPDITSTSRVIAALRKYGFQVGALDNRVLRVVATAGAVERALRVKLNHARFTDGTEALVADRALALDATLAAEGVKIPTFTSVAPMRIHSQRVRINPDNYKSATGPYLAADLRQAYQVPAVTAINGKGVVIGILMSGAYLTSDITDYFNDEDVDFSLQPILQVKNINGGANFNSNTSPETELDITQSSGIALGATEMLYNLPGLDQPTILYGLNEMVSDNVVDVVNMSFGGPEIANTPKYNKGVDQSYIVFIENELFLQGNAQGISFFASSGDHGANPPVGKTRVTTVELPAGDPNVTAVGGINLITKFTNGSTLSS